MAVGNHMMTLRQKALLIKLLNQKGKHVHVAPDWGDFTNTRGWEDVDGMSSGWETDQDF